VVERLTFDDIRSGRWQRGLRDTRAEGADREDDPRARALLP
jgi:hypothetical protein